MVINIPVRKLTITSVVTSVIFTGLIGVLMRINVAVVPNFYKIIIDTFFSICLVGFGHIFMLSHAVKKHPRWSAFKTAAFTYIFTFLFACVYTITVELLIDVISDPEKLAHMKTRQGMGEQLLGAAIITLLVIFSHNQVLLRQRRIDAEVALSETKAANVEATNFVLQQQIQPHFLFNALNVLNGLYKRDYNAGHTYMLHLANFLRASLSSTKQNVLPISEEIKMCNDYVAMQKMRFNEGIRFETGVDSKYLYEGYVPSFSLQPLIENAIKHNELTSENPLKIRLYSEDGFLFVTNNLSPKISPVMSTGQGLENLRKRYELLSGDKLLVQRDNGLFSVRLKILNDEYRHN
ncbi:MAG: histidine kinase [Flavitalea sp.]